MIPLPLKRLTPTARLPVRATAGSCGLDLFSDLPDGPVAIFRAQTTAIPIGWAAAIPAGFCGRILARSGLSMAGIVTGAGLLDSDYRGPIRVVLHNVSDSPVVIAHGQRIAQLLIQVAPQVEPIEVAELDQTARGDRGFGSSGVGELVVDLTSGARP